MFIHGHTLVIALSGFFLFLKGKTGTLAPFSYLVHLYWCNTFRRAFWGLKIGSVNKPLHVGLRL